MEELIIGGSFVGITLTAFRGRRAQADEVREGKSGSFKVALIDRKSGGEPPHSTLLSHSDKLEPHRD